MTLPEQRPETLIIGGGIIGLSLAWELSKRGRAVTVVDAGELGRASSWAGAGILPPAASQNIVDPYEALRSLSHRLHSQWAEELRSATGVDTGYQRCGGIYLATSRGEFATLSANEGWWREHGIEFERLNPAQLVQLEPNLADACPNVLAAWYLPDECQLRNPHHLQALISVCRQNGVRIHESYAVSGFEFSRGRVSGIKSTQGEKLSAHDFCICSGAWTRQLLEQLQIPNGIMPVRGQIVLYRSEQPLFSHVVNEGSRYLVPRRDGRLLAGSVEEEVGYRCETTAKAIASIRAWAERLSPGLQSVPVEKCWAGLRPGSYDGLPYIGRVPGWDNLFLASGHFRSGLHLSCGTAKCLAEVMTGGQSPVDLDAFRVGRG